jgi:hypothetical protein
MMVDELNIIKETIRHQILCEDLRKRKICAKFVPHRLTDEQKQRRLTACQDVIQTCQDSPKFFDSIFLLRKVETALKGRGFRMLKILKKNVTAEQNAVPSEAFTSCFQKLFKQFNKCIQVGKDRFE